MERHLGHTPSSSSSVAPCRLTYQSHLRSALHAGSLSPLGFNLMITSAVEPPAPESLALRQARLRAERLALAVPKAGGGAMKESATHSVTHAPAKRPRVAIAVEETEKKEKALAVWLGIVMEDPESSSLGRRLEQCRDSEERQTLFFLQLSDMRSGTLLCHLSVARAYRTWSQTAVDGYA